MADAPPRISTLFEMLLSVRGRYRDREAFIYRAARGEFTVTFEKFFEDVVLLARAFAAQGVARGDRVMVLSDNRYEWIVTDFALLSLGAVGVPRGTDSPGQELEYIIRHAGCCFLVAETENLLSRHRELVGRLDRLRGIFIVEGEQVHRFFDRCWCYNEMLEDRTLTPEEIEEFAARRDRIGPDDTVTVIYTSGTTGLPKGVILNHRNLTYQVNTLPELFGVTEEDRFLSILPSWHIFERAVEYVALSRGACLIYSSLRSFGEDLVRYRPTLLATVPRLWESLYLKINAGLEKEDPKKARLFKLLVEVSMRFRKDRRILADQLPSFAPRPLLRRLGRKAISFLRLVLLFPLYLLAQSKLAKVREKMGGRLRLALSGGGSLPPYLDEWIDALGVRIANAYGMTETAPAIAGRILSCKVFGVVGPPFPGTELRIAGEGGRPLPPGAEGEVLVRGPQVMPGYWDNEEENRKAFTPDGFLRTGDLGKLTLTGELVLTGRSKEIIVLASGENVDPTRIESTITMFPFVKDAALVGQDRKGLGALIVPDLERLREFIHRKLGVFHPEGEDAFLSHPHVLDRVKSEINKMLHPAKGFRPHERLHRLAFLKEEFKMGEELTNTLKKKRHVIEKKYRDLINRLFREKEEKPH